MNIITDGLIGYWHYKDGINSNIWKNLSPNTYNNYNAILNGAVLNKNGIYLNGSGNYISIPVPQELIEVPEWTIDIWMQIENDISYPDILTVSNRYILDFHASGLNELTIWPVDTTGQNDYWALEILELSSAIKHYVIRVKLDEVSAFENGNLTDKFSPPTTDLNNLFLFINNDNDFRIGSNARFHPKGTICSLRLYNKFLNDNEIINNYNIGMEIGLENSPPNVEIISISKNVISSKENMDKSIINFTFDKDVTEWTVNVMGTSPTTGFIADSGTNVISGEEITAEIDWTELYQEGSNKINIYGKDINGVWTEYQD